MPRAGVARGSGRGALNAGLAWILGGGAADGFGQASARGQDLGELAIGVKLLQLRPQAGPLGRRGGEGDAPEYSSYKKSFTIVR